jgi:hypothetical protein
MDFVGSICPLLRQPSISYHDLLTNCPYSILEGLATVLAGVASFWIIQDFPDEAKFLSEAERTVVVRRLQQDDQFSAAGEKLKMKYIWQSLLDWKTWVSSALNSLLFDRPIKLTRVYID